MPRVPPQESLAMPSPIESAIRKTVTQGVMKLADFNRNRMAEPAVPNPFLGGLNAPMDRELTRHHSGLAGRPLPAHRPQPDRQARCRQPSLVRR
jgi:hypothetical protein